ncbi:uncharacterized protein K460DRAFT_79973 [Cucurbitaria berberidis CBS 394.84]|uniref:F-box domain-containing protein n=1 Tax=Cucurbitaria berberidis CBS 394.84 TaxID=1168544 RepID=A0A9P4LAS2_9PLEO|nr:uncharacterized protein K460DRAFT_79973 [Cucurbitaria berberidis CBS 394.84]KAF1848706.1 hypothetical protein K460DRAFT_79973 [Cucurbitaria berberidis CBS 394.84]
MGLDNLPDEILLRVTTNLGHNALCNLALVAQRYRGIAQEKLYRSLRLEKPHIHHERDGSGERDHRDEYGCIILQRRVEYKVEDGITRVVKLARSLLERRDLANMVRRLDLTVFNHSKTHNSRCVKPDGLDPCRCGWSEFVDICKDSISSMTHPALSRITKRKWIKAIHLGKEVAILGVILASVPNLRELSLSVWYPSYKTYINGARDADVNENHDESTYCKIWLQQVRRAVISPEPMLGIPTGTSDLQQEMMITEVLHLAELEKLSSKSLVLTSLVSLPKLRFLKCGQWFSIYPSPQYRFNHLQLPQPPPLPSMIKELTVEVDVLVMMETQHISSSTRPNSVLAEIPDLKCLQFRIIPLKLQEDLYRQFSFDKSGYQVLVLLDHHHEALETLVIDAAELYEQTTNLEWDEMVLGDLSPMQSLVHYRKLRRVVAPQEAFFSVTPQFDICALPESVERIEIIDTTCAVNRFALYVIANKPGFPNLKTIVLWCYKKPLQAPDPRLSVLDDDEQGEGEEAWTSDWSISESVWDELLKVGIEVLWNTATMQEWRDEIRTPSGVASMPRQS